MLIAKVPGRITVAEFKRAVKATGLKPIQGAFFEWKDHNLCGGCALTIVGVYRGYLHALNVQGVPECWAKNLVPESYVSGFAHGFDGLGRMLYRNAIYLQGYSDGQRCAKAAKLEVVG